MGLSTTQKGKIVENLVALTCILGSDGKLSANFPFIDDEGVDLMFARKDTGRGIAVQVKSRFMKNGGIYKTQIRKQTFSTRKDFYVIFAYFDVDKSQLGDTLWFVPSEKLPKELKNQLQGRDKYIFQSRLNSKDMWAKYRINLKDLPKQILRILAKR